MGGVERMRIRRPIEVAYACVMLRQRTASVFAFVYTKAVSE